jgi:hypothetical protein
LAGNYYFETCLQGLNGWLGFKGYYNYIYKHIYNYKHNLISNCYNHKHKYKYKYNYKGYIEPEPLIFKVRLVL